MNYVLNNKSFAHIGQILGEEAAAASSPGAYFPIALEKDRPRPERTAG